MKQAIILLPALALLTTGCLTKNLPKVVQALAKDPASTHVRISTIYGVMEVSRANPDLNSPTHTVAPDGTITVKQAEGTPVAQTPAVAPARALPGPIPRTTTTPRASNQVRPK